MVLIRWGTRTPPQILEERPAAARIGWNLPPARYPRWRPHCHLFPVRHDFPREIRIRRDCGFQCIQNRTNPRRRPVKIRYAEPLACQGARAGCGTLLPPHKCGSDSAAQTQPRPAAAPEPSSNQPLARPPFLISCHVERKSRQRLEPKHLRLFFGSTDDSHRRVLSRQAPSLPPQHCHPEERSDEGSAVAFSCFRVEHHSIFDCGCRSDLSERNFPIGGENEAAGAAVAAVLAVE